MRLRDGVEAPHPLMFNETLQRVISDRRIMRAQLVFEWPTTEFPTPLVPLLRERISREFGTPQADVLEPPYIGQWQGPAGRSAQFGLDAFIGGLRVVLNTTFTGRHQLDGALAASWIRSHWLPIFQAVERSSTPPTVAAVVVDLHASTLGLDVDPTSAVVPFVQIPGWRDGIADAELRVSKNVDDRYFLNFGLSVYADQSADVSQVPVETDAAGRPTKFSLRHRSETTDKGVRIKLDANTKVNVVKERGPIQVSTADVERLLSLVFEVNRADLDRIFGGTS